MRTISNVYGGRIWPASRTFPIPGLGFHHLKSSNRMPHYEVSIWDIPGQYDVRCAP